MAPIPICIDLGTCIIVLVLVFLLPAATAAAPEQRYLHYNYSNSLDRNFLFKRQSWTFNPVVTGAQGGTGPNGSAPLRREVRDLEQDNTTWTLYLLGLDMMQYTDQSELYSWYQVAGIHGRPFVAWDNVQAAPGNANNGYCNHVSILFATWHRPYLALFEQILYGLIQEIASWYPPGSVQNQYMAAAANFRIPYWDWAAVPPPGQSVLPASTSSSPTISVAGPDGTQVIANPLYAYQFKPLNPNDLPDPPFNQYPETLRYPTTQNSSAVSQNSLVASQLNNNALSIRDRLFNLFSTYHNYTTFSNEAYIPANNIHGYDSIESIHDQIHVLVGSGGHMSYIEYAAFDPIFFLHHTNIDRCVAMWQVLNPNSYVMPEHATYSTYTSSAGTLQDINSPLTPFHSNNLNAFWTSSNVRNTQTFDYAYPETSTGTGVNLVTQVSAAIARLYGSGQSPNGLNGVPIMGPLIPEKRDLSSAASLQVAQWYEWMANVEVQKNALSGSFYIYFFLGPFSSDPREWPFDPNLVGTQCIFAMMSDNDSCQSCDSDQVVTGTIPLTRALMGKVTNGELRSLNPVDAQPYLKSNLEYRVAMLNNTAISGVPSLKIPIVGAVAKRSSAAASLPTWGTMVEYMDLTDL